MTFPSIDQPTSETSDSHPLSIYSVAKTLVTSMDIEAVNKVINCITAIIEDPEQLLSHCSMLISTENGDEDLNGGEGIRITIEIENQYLGLAEIYYINNLFTLHGWEDVQLQCTQMYNSENYETRFYATLPMLIDAVSYRKF